MNRSLAAADNYQRDPQHKHSANAKTNSSLNISTEHTGALSFTPLSLFWKTFLNIHPSSSKGGWGITHKQLPPNLYSVKAQHTFYTEHNISG